MNQNYNHYNPSKLIIVTGFFICLLVTILLLGKKYIPNPPDIPPSKIQQAADAMNKAADACRNGASDNRGLAEFHIDDKTGTPIFKCK